MNKNKIDLFNFFRRADNIYLTKNYIVKQTTKEYVDKYSIAHLSVTDTYLKKNKRAMEFLKENNFKGKGKRFNFHCDRKVRFINK